VFKKNTLLILVLIIISLSITFICQKDALFNKYIIHDDCNQYIFPFYRVRDRQLFQNDIFTDYSLHYNTKGVVIIYNLFSKVIDPLFLSKILPFFLCSLTTIYFFLIGEKIKNIFVGFLAGIIFIMHSWTFSCFSGGHAKAFSFLLLSSLIYYLLIEHYFVMVIILALQIFIYPPVAAISILALLILSFLITINKQEIYQSLKSKQSFFICTLLLGTSLMYLLYLLPNKFMGPLFSFREIIKMPEFYFGGRDPHFITSLKALKNEAIAENIIGIPPYRFPTWFLLSISSIGLFLVIRKEIEVNFILNIFCISGILLFIFAWPLLLNLYSPGRYLKFALITYLIFISALVIEKTFIDFGNNKKFLRLALIVVIIIIIYFPFLSSNLTVFNNTGLYSFLSTLPKDALIAGHPFEINEVPLFSKRKVFIEYELSLPYYKNYYKKIVQRTNDFFKLYYSSSVDEIKNICSNYNINYIVIKKEHFTRSYLDNNNFYIMPFSNKIQEIVLQNKGKGFALLSILQKYKLYEDENYFVVKIDSM